jgi:hypothetical protein
MGLPPPALLITRGNIARHNALRGVSIRSQSFAILDSDFVCGNGTAGRGIGFGVLVQDAAGLSAAVAAEGLAVVDNADGGFVVTDRSAADLGGGFSRGRNAFAFNGPAATTGALNLRHLGSGPVTAVGNQWEHCGPGWRCDVNAVRGSDVFAAAGAPPVAVAPARAARERHSVRIDEIRPSFALAGELVRLYGDGFDAIGGNGPGGDCTSAAPLNRCDPIAGNCVLFGGRTAEVVSLTPTMIVVRSPFDCVEPVGVLIRNRHARGIGRATFCTLPVLGDP